MKWNLIQFADPFAALIPLPFLSFLIIFLNFILKAIRRHQRCSRKSAAYLLFWNQVLTWVSLKFKLFASSRRSGVERYFWSSNLGAELLIRKAPAERFLTFSPGHATGDLRKRFLLFVFGEMRHELPPPRPPFAYDEGWNRGADCDGYNSISESLTH